MPGALVSLLSRSLRCNCSNNISQAGSVSFLTRRVCVCALPDKTINAQEEIEILETDRLAKHAGSIVTEAEVRKRFCPTAFHIKTIILPRQARDRHKEQTTHSKKHTPSIYATKGELVFSFNNEFSWVNNKAISLTTGQWPSRQGQPPVHYGAGGGGGFEPEPEPEPSGRSAAGLLRSLRSGGSSSGGGGGGGGGGGMSAPPPIGGGGGGGAMAAPRAMVANDDADEDDESAPLAI